MIPMKKALSVILCVVIVLSSCATPTQPLTAAELLDLGEKYLLELNYEQALVQFLRVIEIEPMNPRGYTGAAEAYVGLGQTDNAIAILEQGLNTVDDGSIKAMLDVQEIDAGQGETEVTPIPDVILDVQLTPEQFATLESIEAAILAMDYETAYRIAVTPGFRSLLAELSDGGNITYKDDETGLWRLRCTNNQNSPHLELGDAYSVCSIGVTLANGQVYWFDCFGSFEEYSSNFRIYDSSGETTRLTIFDGQTATHHDGEVER
jgi:tetratricopeptide (TPR) repeat protein